MILKTKKNLSNAKLDNIIIGIIMVLGLFLIPLTIRATDSFTDDFDSYTLGDFYSNGIWNVGATETIYIINNSPTPQSYPQELLFYKTATAKNRSLENILTVANSSSTLQIYYNMPYSFDALGKSLEYRFFNSDNTECFRFYFYPVSATSNLTISAVDNDGSYLINTNNIPTDWRSFKIEWYNATSSLKVRYQDNFNNWSDWHSAWCANNIKRINFADGNIDDSKYYEIVFDSFLQDNAYGLCGIDNDCVFCNNKTDCENNNCFWIEDWTNTGYFTNCVPKQPLIEEQASTTWNATSFYTANCNYSSSTGLYLSLTNLTSGFFSYLSSWLSHFSNLFDLTQAQQKGMEFGQSIPKARGYISLFDNLLGNIPFGEIFIIYLTVFIAIIIFRIVRHIKGLLPFQ